MFYGVDVSHRLPRLTMPAAVVQGQHDSFPSSNMDTAKEMASALPDGTLHVIEGSGHVPTLSRPEEVAAIFERLVERSSAVVD